jgi:hypothetical protein
MKIFNESLQLSLQANPLPEFMITFLNEGGMVECVREYKKFSVSGVAGKE